MNTERRMTGTADDLLRWVIEVGPEYVPESLIERLELRGVRRYTLTLVRRCDIGCGPDPGPQAA